MSVVVVLFFTFLYQGVAAGGLYTNLLKHGRLNRHCHDPSGTPILPVEESKFALFIMFISGLLFFLIFLGTIRKQKDHKIGMYGLNLLIELPRPLSSYQEKNLERRPVVYDIGGWPIHPDTLQRTVRVLPKRTEFCLNLVFFLAYPLAACVYICAFCCCIRNMSKSNENACFKHVDVVRLTNHESKINGKPKKETSGLGVYKKDQKEDQDTKYVIDAMHRSKESIQEYRLNLETCSCDANK